MTKHVKGRRVLPALLFGAGSGALTAAVVVLYKWAAGHIFHLSETLYTLFRAHPLWLGGAAVAAVGMAAVFAALYKHYPNLKGGGIPTSIGIIRGFISFRWLTDMLGTIGLSLSTFLIGVPLGNEGPSVQIGTAVGRGCVRLAGDKGCPWDRYAMTGGACAGFSTATGAPISGLLFAVEEAHQKVTPLLLIVAAIAVVCGQVTSGLLAPLVGVEERLFPAMAVPDLSAGQLWLPLAVGVAVGVFGILFLRFYTRLVAFCGKTLGQVPLVWKITAIFALTVGAGLASPAFVSTGHHLLTDLLDTPMGVGLLVLLLVVRTVLTLSANVTGITGGLFLPLMAVGAIPAALTGWLAVTLGADDTLMPLFILLGVTASIAGIMKTPLTAILFALEALSLGGNVLPVVIAATVAYGVVEISGTQSITDCVLEARLEQSHAHKQRQVREAYVIVGEAAFADGKAVNDILWPGELTILSYRADGGAWEDVRGGHLLAAGQELHLRYTTFGSDHTVEQVAAILGTHPTKLVDCPEET